MTSKNVLYVVSGLVVVMGLWGVIVYFAPDFAFGLPVDPIWHGVLKVLVGGFGLYVAFQDK